MSRLSLPFQTVAFWCTCVFVFLTYGQMWTLDGTFASDTAGHVVYVLNPGQAELSGYSLLHTLCGLIYAPFKMGAPHNQFMVASGVMTVLLAGAFYHSLMLVHGHWTEKYPQTGGFRISALTVSVFVVSMIVLMPWVRATYLGVFTGNPWHNPTYTFARVFSILAFLSFLKLTDPDKPGAGDSVNWRLILAAAAVLSVWSKPSFMITLGPAFGVVAVVAWLRGKLTWKQVGWLAACLLPTVVAMVLIRHKIYASSAATNTVVFSPGLVWGNYTPSYAMSLALAAAFPLFVTAVRWRTYSHALFVGAVHWVVAALVFYLLAEEGTRALHANFAWCYMGGLFFFFLVAIEEWFLRPATENRWLRWVGGILFAAHLVSGARYLLDLLQGGPYM